MATKQSIQACDCRSQLRLLADDVYDAKRHLDCAAQCAETLGDQLETLNGKQDDLIGTLETTNKLLAKLIGMLERQC